MTTKTKAFISFGIVALLLLGLGFTFRSELQLALMTTLIHPNHAFGDVPPPTQPDYDNPKHWAALPTRKDLADRVPNGATDLQDTAPADVFFVHPTTYLSPDAWNQTLDDEATNRLTDEMVMQGQASAFNGCCQVYAPRYRQATLSAFFTDDASGLQALALAYQDVVAAFRHFITRFNTDRPFLVAAHSQGSHHADKLLAEEIVGTTLASRLVAAYPVGFEIDGSNGLPVCETPTQTECQVSWNTVGTSEGSLRGLFQPSFESEPSICVNPLTWQIDGGYADHATNLGAVNFGSGPTHEPGAADAQCRDGRLYVSDIRSDHYSLMPLGRDNYHIYDYALYYVNIRQNAQARVDAFLRTPR